MKIVSEVNVIPIKPTDGLIGFASFVLYESVYCGSVGVHTRPNGGYRLTYPKRQNRGRDIDIYYPITKELGLAIEEAVVKKIEEVMSYKNDRYGSAGF